MTGPADPSRPPPDPEGLPPGLGPMTPEQMAGAAKTAGKSCLGGCLRTTIGLVIIGAIAFVFLTGLDSVFNPWAHGWMGRKTLVGTWAGTLTTPSGATRPVSLVVARDEDYLSTGRHTQCSNCPRMHGSAQFCPDAGPVRHYDLWGGPKQWSGATFHIAMRLMSKPPAPGLHLGGGYGEWHADSIMLTVNLERFDGKAWIGSSSDADVARKSVVHLRRVAAGDTLRSCTGR